MQFFESPSTVGMKKTDRPSQAIGLVVALAVILISAVTVIVLSQNGVPFNSAGLNTASVGLSADQRAQIINSFKSQ